MGMNKQKGNMYPFVSHTWNPIRGQCPHDCVYCYMKGFPQAALHLAENEKRTELGMYNFIFVGSSTDMWAEDVPSEWIDKVLQKCRGRVLNTYLFQSKNPSRFYQFRHLLPGNVILGTTIESNADCLLGKAPAPRARMEAMKMLSYRKMVSIEPIVDFDLAVLVDWIAQIKPEFVSIGADSKGHHLSEPTPDKVNMLIEKLSEFTEVKIKDNLGRLR